MYCIKCSKSQNVGQHGNKSVCPSKAKMVAVHGKLSQFINIGTHKMDEVE